MFVLPFGRVVMTAFVSAVKDFVAANQTFLRPRRHLNLHHRTAREAILDRLGERTRFRTLHVWSWLFSARLIIACRHVAAAVEPPLASVGHDDPIGHAFV